MRRRDFITLLVGGTAVSWQPAARAQQPERVRRIAVLLNATADDAEYKARMGAFVQGLQQRGWTEGRNLSIDLRWAADNRELNHKYAPELVALAPDAILAVTTLPVEALQRATRTIPIVFVQIANPVGAGFVETLARPGGNVINVSTAKALGLAIPPMLLARADVVIE